MVSTSSKPSCLRGKELYFIRRQLTEDAVRAADKCARFVGTEAYEAAGGIVMRDLFQQDDGGWLQDPALLDRLVGEKLTIEAEKVRAEGWKWVEAAVDFPYGHNSFRLPQFLLDIRHETPVVHAAR